MPTIDLMGTDAQRAKWLPLARSCAIVGTYAQTELGHGTNLSALETTATYDAAAGVFVLETPTVTATKWWPGGLGKTTTHAVVMARLLLHGVDRGQHAVVVQLRDLETHDLVVNPFEVDHYPVEPAYGYQITFFKEEEEKSIIISGDTRKSENLIKYAHNADALVHEVFVNLKFDEKRMSRDTLKNVKDYHTSPKELGEIANIAQVKKLILTHFVPPIFDESELIKKISEFYKGEIIIGEDLMFIKF